MRFYVSPDSIFLLENIAEIKDKTEIHHIRDVMRLKKGDRVDIFDGSGREFSGVMEDTGKGSVIIKIKEKPALKKGTSLNVTLYQAIPKKTKMDFIVEKAVELGVSRIVPMITERTVPDIKDFSGKIARWKRISVSGAKQSGRSTLPGISDAMYFDNALAESKQNDLVIFASLDKGSIPLKDILRGCSPSKTAVFIGPEGDFSPTESAMARNSGYCGMCSLGGLVLRSETAAIYLLSCLAYEFQH